MRRAGSTTQDEKRGRSASGPRPVLPPGLDGWTGGRIGRRSDYAASVVCSSSRCELVEVGRRTVAVEVDGRLDAARRMTNASRLSATSAGESIGRMNSHTAARSAPSPPGNASRSLRSIRSEPSALVRVTPAGSSTNAAPSRAASWAMPRSGSGSASARSSSASMIASSWRGSWRPVSPTGCWRSGSVQPAP